MKYSASDTSIKNVILSIIDWIKYFLSKWIYLLIFIIVGLLLGYWGYEVREKVFQAETTFVLEDAEQANPLATSLGLGTQAQGLFGSVDNIVWLYTSNAMLKQVLLNHDTIKGKDDLLINFFLQENEVLEDYPHYKEVIFKLGEDNNTVQHNAVVGIVMKNIKKDNLEITSIPKTKNSVSVIFTAKSPTFAIAFINKLVETVNAYYIDTKVGKLQAEIDNINEKLEAIKGELEKNIYEVASTIENIPYPNPNLQTTTVPTKQKTIDVQVNTTTFAQLNQSLETLKLELNKTKPLISIVDKPELPLPMAGMAPKMYFILGGVGGFLFILIILFTVRYMKMVMQ